MGTIRNTTDDFQDPAERSLFLASGLATGSMDEYITGQERAGQAQVVNSDRLPTETNEGSDEPYLALGFTFGKPDPHDPLFRPATLPAGWSRKATDHSMHSKIVDELGRERVGIFYKAAFYDRRADMRLETPFSYLRSALYYGTPVVLDDVWLTREVAQGELEALAVREDRQAADYDGYKERNDGREEYYAECAAEHRADAAKARALAATL
jgi:hypothetical protein